MSDPQIQEPTRLLADSSLDPLLQRDLEIASSHAPIQYSVDAGLSRFEQALHGATTLPPGGSVAGLRVLGWFVGALALVGGLAYLALAERKPERSELALPSEAGLGSPEAEPVVTDEPVATNERVATSSNPAPDPASEVPEPGLAPPPVDPSGSEPEPPSDTSHSHASHSHASHSPSHSPKPDPQPSLADEAAQINAARKALASDPAKTLALVEAAELAFPDGAMLQERRGYAILALHSLGRDAEAETRADAYLERWPKGPLSRRVRDALGR